MEKISSHYLKNFILPILEMSHAENWDEAKLEWKYMGSEIIPGCIEECLCGRSIVEVCYIKNKITGKETQIGNKCVNQFLGGTETQEKSNKIFKALRGIKKNPSYSVNVQALLAAYGITNIDPFELILYLKILQRKKLSPREKEFKIKINKKIENGFTKSTGG